jgi:hypothetical protein
MRDLAVIASFGVLLVAGCGHKQATAPEAAFTPVLIVTPEAALQGKVLRTNPAGKFVVLNFPVGHLPSLEQRLSVYRLGLKVGEVKVTGPQLDDNIVGDVVAGEAGVGDVVRDH